MVKLRSAILRIVAYVSFAMLSLLFAALATFPYAALADRMKAEAESFGYTVRFGSLGPGLLSLRATNVTIATLQDIGNPPAPLKIDSITVGPSVFPLGLALNLKAFGGKASAAIGGVLGTTMTFVAKDLDFEKGNFSGFTGVTANGVLNAEADFSSPVGVTHEAFLQRLSGTIAVSGKDIAIAGGKIRVTIPIFGPEPVPFDLPALSVGAVQGSAKAVNGLISIEALRSTSADLETQGSGTIVLGPRIAYSDTHLTFRLKFSPQGKEKVGALGAALEHLPKDRADPSWSTASISGYLGQPKFQ